MAPMSFKHFVNADYTMSGDGQLAYNSIKRKKSIQTSEDIETEALDIQQRRKLAIRMKRHKARIAMGRKRAARKVANLDKLKVRSRKQARKMLAKKLSKGIDKGELSMARRKEIEKRLDKPQMQAKIARIARKNLPAVRRAEIEKKRGGGKRDN